MEQKEKLERRRINHLQEGYYEKGMRIGDR